jgi:hypothetical protein
MASQTVNFIYLPKRTSVTRQANYTGKTKWTGAYSAVVLGSVLSAALLAACGGGGSDGNTDPGVPPSTAKLNASKPGELLAYVKDKVQKGGANLGSVNFANGPVSMATPSATAAGGDGASPVVFAGTQLQEQGVDEDDLVKTDGSMLYALSPSRTDYANGSVTFVPSRLQAQRRQANGQLAAAGSLTLDATARHQGMYLATSVKRLAVLGQKNVAYGNPLLAGPSASALPIGIYSPQITLDLVSLEQASGLSIASNIRIDGNLVGSRRIGNTLYVVSTWAPNLSRFIANFDPKSPQSQTLQAGMTTADILPSVQIGSEAAQPLLPDTDCYVQPANASPYVEVTTITAFDLSSPSLQRTSRCFVGGSDGLYMSPSKVYVASSRYYSYPLDSAAPVFFKTDSTTDIHKFSLTGTQINYVGSGEVPGHLGWDKDKLSYRLSEYQGDLRVLSFTGQTGWGFFGGPAILPAPVGTPAPTTGTPIIATPPVRTVPPNASTTPPSPATLTILREAGNQTLQAVGSLPNAQRPAPLGKPGEQVYAVQFVGPRAYVVTFRRTDPLYVLDVANPADPKAIGELQMPGFSDYLYTMGDQLLLGVGKDADSTGRTTGVKVALMNVANPASPSLVKDFVIGKNGSDSALSFSGHGITILQQGNVHRIALPVRVHETPYPGSSTAFQPTSQGLHRFEVDTAAQTLVSKPAVNSAAFTANDNAPWGKYYVAHDRSVLIGDNAYYFSGGEFITAGW